MYARILVAVDLATPGRAKAMLAHAQALCDRDGLIRLLHVLHGPNASKLRAGAMAGLLALSEGNDARTLPVLREGAVFPQILALAEADRSDMVMLGRAHPDPQAQAQIANVNPSTRIATLSELGARPTNPERISNNV